jgi:predicted alpha/beta-hydrolase family hydrolase
MSRSPIPTVVLAHGAGAGQAHPWMRHVAAGMEARGCRVVTFDFPYMAEGRKMPDKAPVLEAAFIKVWEDAARDATGPMIAAGKSMGGRMASMVAARSAFTPAPAGLIFFGYPLHPPGKPTQRRDAHLPAVAAPMLFVHGTRDPFGTPDEMVGLTDQLPGASLHLVEKGDHSLITRRGAPVTEELLDSVHQWLSGLP